MESLTTAVDRRLNAGRGWTKLAKVRQLDGRQIEVALMRRNVGDAERVERLLARVGSLEFRILANTRDNKDLIERALADLSRPSLRDKKGELIAWWVPLANEEARVFGSLNGIGTRTGKQEGGKGKEVLVLNDIYNVTGAYLVRVAPDIDSLGKPCLSVTFNRTGGLLCERLTGTHLPDEGTGFSYRLGIILDGMVYSAPVIRNVFGERAQITGSFTGQQVQDLVDVLNGGSFPARIRLVGKKAAP
jgi:SecD/SecF fusion protein